MIPVTRQHATWSTALVAVLALCAGPASGARVEGLYAESVPLTDSSADATAADFAAALRRVLVKVTGQPAVASDPAILEHFPDPASLVQQFRKDGAGNLWAQFDPAAVRRGLDAAGLPVWGEDRPVTVAWVAFDNGAGERDVLSSAGPDSPTASDLRRTVVDGAATAGVPLVLPLRDSQELAAVSFADVWGEFVEPVVRASARYQADAVLIGRARLGPGPLTDVRWTLVVGNERVQWRGAVADGPQGLAQRLAQRLAASAAAGAGVTRLAVTGIRNLDDYGLVLGYLQGLDVVESADVAGASGDVVSFLLQLRGDRDRLVRALAVRRLVEPVTSAGAGDAELLYRFGGGR